MKSEFTAIIETAPEGGYWAICPEVPGANGQGETINEKEGIGTQTENCWLLPEAGRQLAFPLCRIKDRTRHSTRPKSATRFSTDEFGR